jgi:cytochrome b561
MEKPKRYHPLLIALHWILALLIIFMLLVDFSHLNRCQNWSTSCCLIYMATSILIPVLMLSTGRMNVPGRHRWQLL